MIEPQKRITPAIEPSHPVVKTVGIAEPKIGRFGGTMSVGLSLCRAHKYSTRALNETRGLVL
jgi:hypothetical protein